MREVMGLPVLLRSIASRLENSIDGLSKELLLEVADKIENLEKAAYAAGAVVASVPRKSKDSNRSLVPRVLVAELVSDLNAAGRYGPNGDYVKQRSG